MTDLDDLVANLCALRKVVRVGTNWLFHSLEIIVTMSDFDWDVRDNAIELIDDFARANVAAFSVQCHFDVPSYARYAAKPAQAT